MALPRAGRERSCRRQPAGGGAQAQPEQIAHHLGGVQQRLDPRRLDVPPAHRHLDERRTPATGEEQQLDVEGEAVDALRRGECPAELAREELESALVS